MDRIPHLVYKREATTFSVKLEYQVDYFRGEKIGFVKVCLCTAYYRPNTRFDRKETTGHYFCKSCVQMSPSVSSQLK